MLAMKRVTTNVFFVMSTKRRLMTDVLFLFFICKKKLRFAGSKTLWKLDSTYLVHIHNHSMIRTITKIRAQSYTFLAYHQRLIQTDL